MISAITTESPLTRTLYHVAPRLDSRVPFADPALDGRPRTGRITYSEVERRVVVAHRSLPPSLLFYDPAGTLVDELPFGFFMEIEGNEDEIKSAERKLGIKGLRAEHATYPQLTEKHGKRFGDLIEARF